MPVVFTIVVFLLCFLSGFALGKAIELFHVINGQPVRERAAADLAVAELLRVEARRAAAELPRQGGGP